MSDAVYKKTAVVGFDGAVDTRAKVIKKGEESGYYSSVPDFGLELAAHAGKNCSFELEKLSVRFGGNAPLIANALSSMGTETICIGTMGAEELHPVFGEVKSRKISYGDPASTLALEFEDGKTFLEENPDVPDAWEKVSRAVERETGAPSRKLFQKADLLAVVNWSELPYAGKLWKDLYLDCFADEPSDFSRYVFFDLCDISRRSAGECREVLSLIAAFSKKRRSTLGLNRNEAETVGKILGCGPELREVLRKLQTEYGPAEVLVHTRNENLLYTRQGMLFSQNVSLVEKPAVLTGAGDHFSAAYCRALLLGLGDEERLLFATEYAGNYVRTGKTEWQRDGASVIENQRK